jgi:hypothetical protein
LVWFSIALLVLAVSCTSDGAKPSEREGGTDDADAESTPWQEVFTELPGALISVWGEGDGDVWVAGSDPGDGNGAMLLRYDGERWVRLATGVERDLWWIHGFGGGPVFAGGSSGVIVRIEGATVRIEATPRHSGTVFGLWGAEPDDVWAVGGDTFGRDGTLLWRYDGVAFREVDVAPIDLSRIGAIFKVWGTARDDVWFIGTDGFAMHYDGETFESIPTGSEDPFFTVHVSPGPRHVVAAVGGYDLGLLIEHDGEGFASAALPQGVRQLFGVCMTGDEEGYAVGADARVLRRSAGGWADEATGLDTVAPLHAVWVAPSGSVFAVGGDVLTPPLGRGVLVHKGEALPTTYEIEDAIVFDRDAGSEETPEAGTTDAGDDASLDATPAAPEAGPADGSPESGYLGSGSGLVFCGATTCDLAEARCCIDTYAEQPATCVPLASACPTATYSLECDETADCAGAEVCCARRQLQIGGIIDVQCVTTCLFENLCGKAEDCLGGEICGEFEPVGYPVCL